MTDTLLNPKSIPMIRSLVLYACLHAAYPAVGSPLAARPLGGEPVYPYGYLEYLPQGYATGTRREALIVAFHGNGDEGNGASDLAKLRRHGVGGHLAAGNDLAAIVVCPQAPRWFDVDIVKAFITQISTSYRVDPNRIYLIGHSAGGSQVWNFSHAFPDIPAAIVPICGASNPHQADNRKEPARLAGIPIWAFHNFDDQVVGKGNTIRWLNGVAAATVPGIADVMAGYPAQTPGTSAATDCTAQLAGKAWRWSPGSSRETAGPFYNFTMYHRGGHNAWTRTYANPAMWEWLLAQRRNKAVKKGP